MLVHKIDTQNTIEFLSSSISSNSKKIKKNDKKYFAFKHTLSVLGGSISFEEASKTSNIFNLTFFDGSELKISIKEKNEKNKNVKKTTEKPTKIDPSSTIKKPVLPP